ncbi:MAG TPA: outer membrane lipoprotein carrier protein LolA [Candidatus Limnocylindria bacterium]|nr:outer membrane lipoprotein carrier protein LolA [Candidatus Limnocylindria bacterium]
MLLFLGRSVLAGPEDDALLGRWLARQTNVTSWSADFVQTRHLKALTQPLTTPGRVWFVAPDKFRWELGSPAQSIALRANDDLLVLAPRLKRAEKYSLAAFAQGPMKDALALLDTGFPRDAADFRRRFDLLGLAPTNATYAFRLQPRAPSARKLLPELTIIVNTNDFSLSGTELVFTDGSRLRNDFTHTVDNPVIDPALFQAPLDATWKVTEPMKAK